MFCLITLPIYQRAWVLPTWLELIEQQTWPMSDLGFQFEAAPNDHDTMEILVDFSQRHPELRCFDISINTSESHVAHPEGFRTWTRERYEVMAKLRNILLNRAVCYRPDRLFSLDSDILLEDPTTISELVRLTETLDAVAPLLFMTPKDIQFPSVMTWGPQSVAAGRIGEYPLGSLFESDVIMAAVMMTPRVYSKVRYHYHPQGEDLGFSFNARSHRFRLWSASYIYCPHIMSKAALEEYKASGDPRKVLLPPEYYERAKNHD